MDRAKKRLSFIGVLIATLFVAFLGVLALAGLASVALVPDMKVTAYAGSNDSVYTPLIVTGFDADVVADDGTWANYGEAVNGRYIDATEYTIEDYGHVFVSSSFGDGEAFPAGERISTASGKSYTLQSSTANNALQVAKGSGFSSKTLTLTTPGSYEKIGVLSTGGGGDASLLVVVHYSDGSASEPIPLSSPDWYGGSAELRVYGPLSRTQNYNPDGIEGTGAYLFETTIAVDPDKAVTSIDFNFNGNNNAVANIFAISGMAAELKHTVTFDLNGHGDTAPAIQKVSPEGKATKPSDPQESGYTFSGWYKESNCEAAWDFATDTVTSNITLYAKWVEKPHIHDGVTLSAWTKTDSLPTSGNYYLTADVTVSSSWNVPSGETYLCLNGHNITKTDSGSVIIANGATVTLHLLDCDEETVHYYTPNTTGVATLSNAATEYSFVGGYVTGGIGTQDRGGGLRILNGANVVFGGGTLFGNKAGWGGGIFVSTASLTIEGTAKVIGNYSHGSWTSGGGIFMEGHSTVTMTGGSIRYNAAEFSGGGVRDSIIDEYYFTMTGGEITGNYSGSDQGNGFCFDQAMTFKIGGSAKITGNQGTNDLLVTNGRTLTIVEPFTDDVSIGIKMQSGTGAFTSGWKDGMGDADPADYFTPDNGYDILLIGGEAVCGIQPVASVTNGDVTTEYQTFAEALSAWADGTTLTLLKDVTSDRIDVKNRVPMTLDLNGKTITLVAVKKPDEQRVISVTGTGTTLNIRDSSGTNAGRLTGVNPTNDDGWSGAIYINSGSIVNMYGGTISGNNSIRGAGVWIDGRGHGGNATFNMYGGLITGNTSTKPEGTLEAGYSIGGGGGVFVGVYLGTTPTIGNATFNMYGGTITDNAGTNGDNVYIDRGVMNMVGGTIDGGFAHSDYVTVTFDANGGTGMMSVQYVKKSTNTQVKDNTYYDLSAVEQDGYAREGYILSGWNTQADGKGTKYAVGTDNVNFGEDTTLYAMWKSLRVVEAEDLIDEIPTPVTEEDKEKIEEARKAYDDLTEGEKDDVDDDKRQKLFDAEIGYVEVLIDRIPDPVTGDPETKEAIDEARKAYDDLTDDEKNDVDEEKRQKLFDAEVKYVEELIDKIPDPITDDPETKDAIEEARKAYDDLPDEKKGDVDNYEMLVQAEVRYVEVMIESIGTVEYTPDSKAKIDLARTEYDALADGAKEIVSNKQVLLDAEGAYAKLKNDNEQADAVDALIDLIDDTIVYPSSKAAIDAARAAYDALTDEQKALVDDYQGLIDAEKAYDAMDKIDAIGTVEYTVECKDKIDAARKAYDNVPESKKDIISNYPDLENAENEYARLEFENAEPEESEYKISGIVRADDEPLGGVTMTLKKGKQTVTTVTRSDGSYRFILPKGVYSIVAEYDGIVETTAISLFADTEKDITLSGGKTESTLEVVKSSEGAEEIVIAVDGLDREAQTIREAENVSADQSVSVVMRVAQKAEEEIEAEPEEAPAKSIQNAAPERDLAFYEITVEKTVDNVTTPLDKTVSVLEIAIPCDFADKKGLAVYSYHDNEVLTFIASDNKEVGTFRVDKENKIVYIYTNSFSTYAIGYTPYYHVAGTLSLGSFTGTATVTLTDQASGTIYTLEDVALNAVDFTGLPKGHYLMTVTWTDGATNSITMPISVGSQVVQTDAEPDSNDEEDPEDAPAAAEREPIDDPFEETADDLDDVVLEDRKTSEELLALPKKTNDRDAA